jgi:serine/threonine protein kinase
MVMEYMPLGDLHKCLRKLQPVKFMLDIAQGMKYLHSHRIIHRDLAPQNILVHAAITPVLLQSTADPHVLVQIDSSKTAKIADFGLAKHEDDPDDPNTKWVTHIGYKAPEACRHGAVYGLPVDVYGYGKLFKEVYSLNDFQQSSRVDHDLMNLAERCVVSAPTKRPTFAAIVDELQALVLEDA